MAASKEQLIDKLWPDVEPEKAANYFRVSCTYLRKALDDNGFADIFLRDRDNYLLDTEQLNCDMHKFLSKARAAKLKPIDYAALEEAAELYTAPYFQDRIFEWSSKHSLWLENEYKMIQNILADEYVRREQHDKACACMKMVLLHDQFDEQVVLRLINILLQTGDTTYAKITYGKYKESLWKELGLTPSDKLQKLME